MKSRQKILFYIYATEPTHSELTRRRWQWAASEVIYDLRLAKTSIPRELPSDLKVQEINLNGTPIVECISGLIDQGVIPGMKTENLYIKDITEEAAGTSQCGIILIGYTNEDKAPTIVYVLKAVKTDAIGEIDDIQDAYLHWRKRPNAIMQSRDPEGCTLKFSWHERIFHDANTDRYYELLHAAQGQLMNFYDMDFTDRATYRKKRTNII